MVTKNKNTLRDDDAIVEEVPGVFVSYFDNNNCNLGQIIDLSELGNQLLNIEGVDSLRTERTDINLSAQGLSLSVWNPVYTTDIVTTNQNVQLPDFKFPYLNDVFKFYKKIKVVD